MKTFEQFAEEYYQKSGWAPTEGAVMNFKAGFESCDQAWREELGKDRGVKSFNDWWELNRINHRLFGDADSSVVAGAAWADCESLWRHKCLNIEQASSMKIAILERQLADMKEDLNEATKFAIEATEESVYEGTEVMREIRQRHKLDEVSK